MPRALIVVDPQWDFVEKGALAVEGGVAALCRIEAYLASYPSYELIVSSRDWHSPDNDNGGHFSDTPDYLDTWPPHCVAGTKGAEYHPAIDHQRIQDEVRKGQGCPAYSAFEGTVPGRSRQSLADLLELDGITEVDVVGLATDYCVRATALDAAKAGYRTRVLVDLTAAVHPERLGDVTAELTNAGVTVTTVSEI